jgi:GNAT superfamily N-acetyltransferase
MVRLLTPEDAPEYTEIRRAMLQDTPWSFAASPESDRAGDPENLRRSLTSKGFAIAGGCSQGVLVSVAGIRRESHPKRAHIAWIWGVYTRPEHRRLGWAGRVMSLLISTARSWGSISWLYLGVSDAAPEARALYASLGFEPWAQEVDAIRVDGVSYSETMMRMRLDHTP